MGEAETFVAGLLREAEIAGGAEAAMRLLARKQDELERRIAQMEAHAGLRIDPPKAIPQMGERLARVQEQIADEALPRLR